MARHLTPSTGWLLLPAALVVLVAVVAVAVGDPGRGGDLDDDAPAAVVRDFVHAHQERDVDAMRRTLAADLRSACSEQEVLQRTRNQQNARVTLVSSEQIADVVEVEIRHTRYRGEPPFGDTTYETQEVFVLAEEADRWVIIEIPWPFRVCGGWSR